MHTTKQNGGSGATKQDGGTEATEIAMAMAIAEAQMLQLLKCLDPRIPQERCVFMDVQGTGRH